MISIIDYNQSFENMAKIDQNSWVYFETKTIFLKNGIHVDRQDVLVPEVYTKPCTLVRLIYWFFQVILKRHVTTADNLVEAVETASKILTPDEDDLLVRVINTSRNILTRLNTKHPELSTQLARINLCQYRKLGSKALEVGFSMDWERDDPILFDLTYINALYEAGLSHSDINNDCISLDDKNTFVKFINNIMVGCQIEDHYGNPLSTENTNRLRQMMLAIMNLLNNQREEKDFKQKYAAVVLQICLALQNCSNGINTNIEAIFMSLALPKEGNIGYRIRLALQMMRDTIFRKAILECICKSSIDMEHEAASVNYYYRQMSQEFGLPLTIAALDERWAGYARKGQEGKIRDFFFKQYTPVQIIQYIFHIIYDPLDPTIPAKAFTDWMENRYALEERYDLLTEDGTYKPEFFIQLLQELQVIN